MKLLWNGSIVEKENVQVSWLDRGYLFGDGIYEVYRVYNGSIYEREAHNERLVRSAKEIRIALPWKMERLDELLDELIRANALQTGTVYIQVSRGVAPRAHPFPAEAAPQSLGFCSEAPRPVGGMRDGIAAVTVPDIRWHRCDIKTLNLLPNTMAKQQSLDAGAQEAVMHRSGTVTECSASNFFIVKDGMLVTHPADNWILHGITRAVILRLAKDHSLPAEERTFTLEEMLAADEAFIAGTTVEITPVIRIDGRPVGGGEPGPLTRKLQELFEETIPGR